MHSPDDELDDLLGAIDPTTDDPPPHRGSDRHRSILEHAMTTTDHDTDLFEHPSDPATGRSDRRGRRLLGAAAAVLAIAAVAAVVLAGSNGSTDPADPADPPASTTTVLGEIRSLRGEMVIESAGPDAVIRRSSIRVDGDDAEVTGVTTYPDGTEERASNLQIGDVGCEVTADETTVSTVLPEHRRASFGVSSAAVLGALLDHGAEVERTEVDLDGIRVTRVELAPNAATVAALEGLSPGELSWFELEYPTEVGPTTVWFSGDVIRRLGTTIGAEEVTIDYSEFNSEVVIEPPVGPCRDAVAGG